jgi:DNA helicase-2/ATP-dependent DNA helicase PcrA
MEKVEEIPGLPKLAVTNVQEFHQLMAGIRKEVEDGNSAVSVLEHLIEAIGFYAHLDKQGPELATDRKKAVGQLLEIAAAKTKEGREKIAEDLIQIASLSSDADEIEDNDNRVLICTIHAAKGLEWPIVFVPALEEGHFPDLRYSEGTGDDPASRQELEEERRLMYVAMTRARERLFLSFAKVRSIRGMPTMTEPSRFINEALGEDVLDEGIWLDDALF